MHRFQDRLEYFQTPKELNLPPPSQFENWDCLFGVDPQRSDSWDDKQQPYAVVSTFCLILLIWKFGCFSFLAWSQQIQILFTVTFLSSKTTINSQISFYEGRISSCGKRNVRDYVWTWNYTLYLQGNFSGSIHAEQFCGIFIGSLRSSVVGSTTRNIWQLLWRFYNDGRARCAASWQNRILGLFAWSAPKKIR